MVNSPIKIIRHKIISIVRLIPAIDVIYIFFKAKTRTNIIQILRPISFFDYSKREGIPICEIEPKQIRKVYEPAFFRNKKSTIYEFESPSIYVIELDNVIVHGGTGLVISRDEVLTDICANDTDNRVLYTYGALRRGNKRKLYIESSKRIEEVDTAINLCGLASGNYYHLTMEILSRYGYLKGISCYDSIPVLINNDAKKFSQFADLVKTILGEKKIIFVSDYSRILCKKLIYPSMDTWMPINVKNKSMFRLYDNMIAESAVGNIREMTRQFMVKKTNRKVYVTRKNTFFSRITNENEVETLFEKNGFEIVCTEDLSYKNQIELFSSASCIVGSSGAALTNLVYCNPGAVFGCIIPKEYRFCVYSTIAYYVGCKMMFLDAKVYKKNRYIAGEKCTVDLDECREYITKLENLYNMPSNDEMVYC